jgi:hypothetical protein
LFWIDFINTYLPIGLPFFRLFGALTQPHKVADLVYYYYYYSSSSSHALLHSSSSFPFHNKSTQKNVTTPNPIIDRKASTRPCRNQGCMDHPP